MLLAFRIDDLDSLIANHARTRYEARYTLEFRDTYPKATCQTFKLLRRRHALPLVQQVCQRKSMQFIRRHMNTSRLLLCLSTSREEFGSIFRLQQ